MKRFFCVLFFVAALSAVALAKPSKPLRDIRVLFDAGASGNAYFNAQLRQEIRRAGFAITRDKSRADAQFSTRGDWISGGGFRGQMTIRNLSGRVIWRANVTRSSNSRVMAFDSLGQKLRAAK